MLSRVWLRTLKTGKRITYNGETVGANLATVRTTLALERQGQVRVEYHLVPPLAIHAGASTTSSWTGAAW